MLFWTLLNSIHLVKSKCHFSNVVSFTFNSYLMAFNSFVSNKWHTAEYKLADEFDKVTFVLTVYRHEIHNCTKTC